METPRTKRTLFLLIVSLSTLHVLSLSSFTPVDNHLIDCGSTVDSIIDNRRFIPDSSPSNSPSTLAISLIDRNPSPNSPQIYHTARVFESPSQYEFKLRDSGTHMVRLHFERLKDSKFDFSHAQFHVLVNGYVVLSHFSGDTDYDMVDPIIKEYLIWVDCEKLVITFVPTKRSKFAFVNAIEVISAPKDLIADTAQYLIGDKVEDFNGVTKQALEIVYRINVGGPKVTPFNDTLWRTWVPDNVFLKSSNGSHHVYSSGQIKYQMGGASREVCPDNVYNTARVITSENASIPHVNLTWEFPVMLGYKYLVRMHFCDIASISIGLLYFNVYINGNLAYKDLDLSYVTSYMLASPFYADFVADGDCSRVLRVSVGPSSKSMAYAVDGILNGMEVMKMNNTMGSLDGELRAELVMKSWPKGNIGILVPLIAGVLMLVSISLVMRRRMVGLKDSVAWSKLPTDIPEVHLKHTDQQLPVKM
ncbi:Malectin_like domain-containing protein [Cephalotus follicularis]|uniref:Malectin_like domain-containing protein n=1 Tax=Cephalotus follicularis TaxID=3775 RepID=A0A1Q3DCN2_CEPFO|nr:Malectin_like domain-containing protein [Cephalotus follicularis]